MQITTEDKFVKLNIELPIISKGNYYNNIELIIPSIEVKEGDLIAKLCEKAEKLNIIELKLKYIFSCISKTEEDFDKYVEARFIYYIEPQEMGILVNSIINAMVKIIQLLL